ncbi:MAG: ribonuclease P protein component [Chitinivibrionia bacterium]|jgi:RNase P protein component|nr:ribonuclease P protein component [Chitinivibrionia bacterium]
MRNCYKKAFRLKKQKEIASLVRNAQRNDCGFFVVVYEKNGLAQDRFNVLVSRRNGGAVERVRIKRIYREAYINTPVVSDGSFYDILVRPAVSKQHEFGEILKLYGKWRNETIKNDCGKFALLSDTVC